VPAAPTCARAACVGQFWRTGASEAKVRPRSRLAEATADNLRVARQPSLMRTLASASEGWICGPPPPLSRLRRDSRIFASSNQLDRWRRRTKDFEPQFEARVAARAFCRNLEQGV
jgi:hypothetical protein